MKYNLNVKTASTYLFMILMQLHYYLGSSGFLTLPFTESFRNMCFFASIALLVLNVLYINRKFTYKEIAFILLALFCAFWSYFYSGGQTFIKLLMFAFAVKEVEEQKVFRAFFYSHLISMALVVFSSLFGWIGNMRGVYNGRVCYTLGFNNPNTTAMLFFVLIATWNWLQYSRLTVWILFIELFLTGLIWRLTNSRSMLVASLLCIGLLLLEQAKICLDNHRGIRFLVRYSFPILSIFSFLIAKYYSPFESFWQQLNKAFTWRPYYYHRYYSTFSINAWGERFVWSELGPLDNAYLMLLYGYGVVILLVYSGMFVTLIANAQRNNDRKVIVFAIVYQVYFLTEYVPTLININLVVLCFLVRFWARGKGGFMLPAIKRRKAGRVKWQM